MRLLKGGRDSRESTAEKDLRIIIKRLGVCISLWKLEEGGGGWDGSVTVFV
jgi:hypothetical protein